MESPGEPPLGREEGRETLHPLPQRLERLMTCRQIGGSICAVIDLAAEDGSDQVRPLREMPVHGAHA